MKIQARKKPHEIILLFLFLIQITALADDKVEKTEPTVAKRNHISFSLGAYTLQSGKTKSSSPGAISVIYSYSFTRRWSALAGYVNLMKISPTVGTIASGFDFGIAYCFFNCSPEKRVYSGVAQVTEYGTFGLSAALGLAQRSFTLTNSTVGFSGIFFKLEGNYFINERFRALLSIQQSSMSNSSQKLSYQSASIGLGFDFGTGPGDLLGNIMNQK